MTLLQLVVKEGLITGNIFTIQFNISELKIETELTRSYHSTQLSNL